MQFLTSCSIGLQLAQQERARALTKNRQELMLKEIQALPDNTPMYQAVGKA